MLEKTTGTTEKSIADTNGRSKNFCMQNVIGFIDNNNIKQNSIGKKKLHLGQRGNSVSAKNLLK